MPMGPHSSRKKSANPAVQYAELVKQLESRIRQLENAKPAIPLLNEDPPESSGINMWVFPDGRMRVRLPVTYNPTTYTIVEFAAVALPGGSANTIGNLPTLVIGPQTYLSRYEATWVQTYNNDGNQRADLPGIAAWGFQDAITTRNKALIGFDYTTIAADLANSTITSVQLELQVLDTPHSKTTAHFGIHNYTAAPATWGALVSSQIAEATLAPNMDQTCDLTLAFATTLRAGTGKGIAIEAPSSSIVFSGKAAGTTASGYQAATLIIEYAK